MDIGSILAAADAEVDYDKEGFEEINTEKVHEAQQRLATAPLPSSTTITPKPPSRPRGGSNTMGVLQAAAQTVAKEEKQEVLQVFKKTAEEVVHEVKQAQGQPKDSNTSENNALAILTEASKEVATYHNLPTDSPPVTSQDLIFACYQGQADIVHKLLRNKADLLFKDRHGWNGLHWAAARGHLDVIQELVDFRKSSGKKIKPFLHLQDQLAGWTPLHVACINGQKEVVQLLLDLGASRKKKDRMGEKPIEVIGEKKKSAKMIRRLLGGGKEEEEKEESKSNNKRYAGEEKSRSPSPDRGRYS
eukprot:gene3874-4232_t